MICIRPLSIDGQLAGASPAFSTWGPWRWCAIDDGDAKRASSGIFGASVRSGMRRLSSLVLLVAALRTAQPAAAEPLFPNSSYPAGTGPSGIALADLDRDGMPDLAVADGGSDSVLVRLGQGDGTFGAETRIPCGPGPTSIAAGDVSGDSVADLVVTNTYDNQVTTLVGKGDGTFYAPFVSAVQLYPGSVKLLDLDFIYGLDIIVIT